jgi:hypothetical protein
MSVLKLSQRQNSLKFSRADVHVNMQRFSDVSRTEFALILRLCRWFGKTRTDDYVSSLSTWTLNYISNLNRLFPSGLWSSLTICNIRRQLLSNFWVSPSVLSSRVRQLKEKTGIRLTHYYIRDGVEGDCFMGHSPWTAWPMKVGLTGHPEMSVNNYQHTFSNMPEEWRSQPHRFESQKLCPLFLIKTTDYGLDSPGIKSRWGQDFLHTSRLALGPTQPPVQ